jgi:hypothetical protein
MSVSTDTVTTGVLNTPEAAALLVRLNEPETIAALDGLLDSIGTLSGLLAAADSFLARGDEVMENVAGAYWELAGVAASETGATGALAGAAKLAGQAGPLVGQLADSQVLTKLADPALLGVLSTLLGAVTTARAEVLADPAGHEYGLMKAARVTKDPDVRRGIGFTLAVMKELGRSLGKS